MNIRIKKGDAGKSKISAETIIIFVLLVLYIIALALPLFWSVIVSFTDIDAYDNFYVAKIFSNIKIPFKKTVSNYQNAWKYLTITAPTSRDEYNVIGLYIHSLKYSLISATMFTLCPCLVAYATARYKFKFSKFIYGFVIVAMSLPIVGSMPSEIRMLKNLHIYGTFASMGVLRFNFLSVYFLIFYAEFQSIPKDYTEAAKIDGASQMEIMLKIIMPLALGTMLTVFVLSFISYWNDFQIPVLYLPEYPTAAYCIYYFMNTAQGGSITSETPVQMAGTVIMTIPILIVFIVFNKRLRVSVAIGGIKG